MVKRELRDSESVCVNGILQNGLESGNNKPFWKYVKSPKQYTFGISSLKSNGNVITDSLSKAEILNSQFKSVFTLQSENTFPQLPGTQPQPTRFTRPVSRKRDVTEPGRQGK